MTHSSCLNYKKLIRYFDNAVSSAEKAEIERHLEECDHCAQCLLILNQIDHSLAMKKMQKSKKQKQQPENSDCLSDEQLLKYAEGSATDAEILRIEAHLSGCSRCLREFSALVKIALIPATEKEKAEIAGIQNVSEAQQLEKILRANVKEPSSVDATDTGFILILKNIYDRAKQALSKFWGTIGHKRFAMGLVTAALLFVIGYPRFENWRSRQLTKEGISIFTEHYFINARDLPRPSGGFQYSEFRVPTRGAQEKAELIRSKYVLTEALQKNPHNLLARRYLGTYVLIIEKNYDKASQFYFSVLKHDSTDSNILNDLGVLSFYHQQYDNAVQYFLSALEYNPHHLEARYNLSIMYQLSEKPDAAKTAWLKCLQLDSTQVWANIAREHLEHLP